MNAKLEGMSAQIGDAQDRIKWRIKIAVSDLLPKLGVIANKQHEIQADSPVMYDKCQKEKKILFTCSSENLNKGLLQTQLIFSVILSASMDEVCRMAVDSGPCGRYADMYYYDVFSGKCHPFIYGGCGGNMNRFTTKQECEARCSHIGAERNVIPYVQVTEPPAPPYVPYIASPPPAVPIFGKAFRLIQHIAQ